MLEVTAQEETIYCPHANYIVEVAGRLTASEVESHKRRRNDEGRATYAYRIRGGPVEMIGESETCPNGLWALPLPSGVQ